MRATATGSIGDLTPNCSVVPASLSTHSLWPVRFPQGTPYLLTKFKKNMDLHAGSPRDGGGTGPLPMVLHWAPGRGQWSHPFRCPEPVQYGFYEVCFIPCFVLVGPLLIERTGLCTQLLSRGSCCILLSSRHTAVPGQGTRGSRGSVAGNTFNNTFGKRSY